jgi:acyl-CoA thioester hydrolase
MSPDATIAAPIDLHRETVRADWIDYNGHMNVAFYVLVFDHATDRLMDALGLDEAYRQRTGRSLFALEQHIVYLAELRERDRLRITCQLVDHDTKRLHFFHRMYHAERGYLAATTEILALHVDLSARRAREFPLEIMGRLARMAAAHAALERPEQAGRVIGLKKRPA